MQISQDNEDSPSLAIFDSCSIQEYKKSLESSSNACSITLLKASLRNSNEEQVLDNIFNTAKDILQNKNTSNISKWRSSLSNFSDPIKLFEASIPTCCKCSEKDFICINSSLKNDCKCNRNFSDNFNKDIPVMLLQSDSSQEAKSEDEQLKTKARLKKLQPKRIHTPSSSTSNIEDCTQKGKQDDNDEYDKKAHKSLVAKITFKTAREQLLGSNPAARRTLGASRKAQAKFISPMLGAAQEKQVSEASEVIDDRLKHIDPKMIELIESEIIDKGSPIGWDDIAGLQLAKSVIQEAVVWPLLRPDIFTGLRRPPKGILLFGPPGTGKTLIGKCVAAQCRATFFSISASSLTSKWIGDGEKMVRALFAVARCHQPAVIFIDEIDSLLTARSDSEHESTRRIKTEFLVQFDGAATGEEDRLLIVGATNRPQELDEAARRRLVKRLYIPLPDTLARKQIILNLLKTEDNVMSCDDVEEVARLTEGFSGADMKSLCSEAAMGPIRSVPMSQIINIDRNKVRAVNVDDFRSALQRVRPSVSQDDLGQYVKWDKTYGQGF
ncbi:unnamed protein product [Leptidea sinapis]|uniref:Fidgetin-like protein 1 n=1 Tax=Leptidea sinapis TaxID=189913 RepID=A0A5E4QG07_9NEOP|nr:unnamed protein product [Leptidea sinapis]